MASCSSAFLRSLLDLVLGVVQVGEGFLLVLVGVVALVLIELVLGLGHLALGIPRGPPGALGVELGQALELALQLLLDLRLLLGQLLELVLPLLRVRVRLGVARRLQVLRLPLAELAHLGLGFLQLLHQARELALAPVLDRVHELAQLLPCRLLLASGLAHLVLLELVGGLAHLGRGPLLAALLGRVAHGRGGQRVGFREPLGELVHAFQQVLQPLGDLALAASQVPQLGLLLGRERLRGLAHQVGLGGSLRRLLHRLFLLLQEALRVLDHAAVGLELAEALEHLLQFVGDGLLVDLGLGERLPSGLPGGAGRLGPAGRGLLRGLGCGLVRSGRILGRSGFLRVLPLGRLRCAPLLFLAGVLLVAFLFGALLRFASTLLLLAGALLLLGGGLVLGPVPVGRPLRARIRAFARGSCRPG